MRMIGKVPRELNQHEVDMSKASQCRRLCNFLINHRREKQKNKFTILKMFSNLAEHEQIEECNKLTMSQKSWQLINIYLRLSTFASDTCTKILMLNESKRAGQER